MARQHPRLGECHSVEIESGAPRAIQELGLALVSSSPPGAAWESGIQRTAAESSQVNPARCAIRRTWFGFPDRAGVAHRGLSTVCTVSSANSAEAQV